jgi:hypothetical protein
MYSSAATATCNNNSKIIKQRDREKEYDVFRDWGAQIILGWTDGTGLIFKFKKKQLK